MPLPLGRFRPLFLVALALSSIVTLSQRSLAQRQRKFFISVDMEGIGGIGTAAMTSPTGKDYATGRRLMTDEVNAVIAAILQTGPADILVNDSHGDMQNLLHTDLDPRASYIQGAVKPFGMVQGLDSTFDAAIFLGYHARAGTAGGFLAHTGTGAVKGLWLGDLESGEGDLNAAYAGSFGVPVILAAGDSSFAAQFARNVPTAEIVATKVAETPQSARLLHPQVVRDRLAAAAKRAIGRLGTARPMRVATPVRVRLRLSDTTIPALLEAIPGVRMIDGFTVEFTAPNMREAYRLIRLMYRYVNV